ncbi:hypothetical protein [Pseudomonas sp. ZL2]
MDLIALPASTKVRVTVGVDPMVERMAVQRPYFAFDTLYQTADADWDIWGNFKPEQPLGAEAGPLTLSECIRHLSTLGACAAALAQHPDERVHYLADHAIWTMHRAGLNADRAMLIAARARVSARSGKRVEANAELLTAGVVSADLTVSYQALPAQVFDLAFADHGNAGCSPATRSPYRRMFPLLVLSLKRHAITACSVDYSAERCAGHFPDHPMWPVSAVLSGLCEVMSQLLAHEFQRCVEYTVMHAEMRALRLVAASEQLLFSATLMSVSCEGRVYSMSCSATHGRAVVVMLDAVVVIRRD